MASTRDSLRFVAQRSSNDTKFISTLRVVRMRGEMARAEPQTPRLADHDHAEYELRDASKHGLPAIANPHPRELRPLAGSSRTKTWRDEAGAAVRHGACVFRRAREAVVAQPSLGETMHGDQRDTLRGARPVLRDAERNEVGLATLALFPALGSKLGRFGEAEPVKVLIVEAHH